MSAPNLDTIPVETLEGICDFVDNTGALKSLRLASRKLRIMTENVFAKRQFTHLNVVLAKEDLEKLVTISTHPVFSRAVRSLRVSPRYFGRRFSEYAFKRHGNYIYPMQTEPKFDLPSNFISTRQQLQTAREQHSDLCLSQLEWRRSEDEASLLASAFQGIVKLVRLDIGFEDPRAKAWKTGHPITGQPIYSTQHIKSPYCNESGCYPVSHGFAVVMEALIRTPLALQELCAGGHPHSLDMQMLKIPKMCRSSRLSLQKTMGSVTVVDLSFDVAFDRKEPCHGDSLVSFLSMAPELRSLRLRFHHKHDPDVEMQRQEDYGDAQCIEENLRGFFLKVQMPKLRTLRLENACLKRKSLFSFLQKHQSHIAGLHFSDMWVHGGLTGGSPPFTKELGSIIAKCPSLVDLSLSRVMTAEGIVLFEPQATDCMCKDPMVCKWGTACSHSELKVVGEAVRSPSTAKLLSEAGMRKWAR